MNLNRRIKKAEKALSAKRGQMRSAKANERNSMRRDVYDLEAALSELKEQEKLQEAW